MEENHNYIDMEDDFYSEDEFGEDYDYCCVICGEPSCLDTCVCGAPLCPMHFELGAGFCNDKSKEHQKIVEAFYKNYYLDQK